MKRIATLIAAAAALALSVAACGGGSSTSTAPAKAASLTASQQITTNIAGMKAAALKGDYAGLQSFFTAEGRTNLDAMGGAAGLAAHPVNGFTSTTIERITIKGNTALVVMNNPDGSAVTVPWVKTTQDWKEDLPATAP